jgi:hypothetical protein
MVFPVRRAVLCTGLAVATALAGCSSSGGDTSPSSGLVSPAGSAGSSQPDAATARAITRAFKVFFDTDTSLAASAKVLQHGPNFRKTLAAESNSPSANDITVKVSNIALRNREVADVKFTILTAGKPLLPDTQGVAVREGGTWKVAAATFCALLQLEGTAPAICNDKSITGLPS